MSVKSVIRKAFIKKLVRVIIKNFTGISDPYEAPEAAEISIDTSVNSIVESVKNILNAIGDH